MKSKKEIKSTSDAIMNLDLKGKVFLVTGGYSGLGAASTAALLKANGKVIIVGRSKSSQDKFVQELLGNNALNISPDQIDAEQTMDLGNLASVSQFAKYIDGKYDQIDVLMNNAGVMRTPAGKTKDGFEIQMGTNVIGHFLLAKILAPKTKRQVWLSSAGHSLMDSYPGEHSIDNAPRIDIEAITNVDEENYHTWRRYQQSKLGDILLSKQFLKEYPLLESYSVHPGVVQTNLSRHFSLWNKLKAIPKLISGQIKMTKPEDGASTQVYCSVAPSEELENGAYYADSQVAPSSKASNNLEDAKKLYDYCDEVTNHFNKKLYTTMYISHTLRDTAHILNVVGNYQLIIITHSKIMIYKVACILILLLLIGCKPKPEKVQLEQTTTNIDCYKKLNELFLTDSLLWKIKDSTLMFNAKGGLLLAKDSNYRFISTKKILPFIDSTDWYDCNKILKDLNDFIGARLIDEQLIIFEVAINPKQTVSSQFSRYHTQEITRLIYNKGKLRDIDWSKCAYGKEVELMKDELDEDWTLLVTKVESFIRISRRR